MTWHNNHTEVNTITHLTADCEYNRCQTVAKLETVNNVNNAG